MHSSLKVLLAPYIVAFFSGNEPEIEEGGKILWISAQAVFEVTLRLVMLSEVPVAGP